MGEWLCEGGREGGREVVALCLTFWYEVSAS